MNEKLPTEAVPRWTRGLDRDEVVSILDVFQEPAILLSPDYDILGANQAYRRLYDVDAGGNGQRCYEASHNFRRPCDEAGETCPLRDTLATGKPHRTLHVHHTARGKEHVDVEMFPIYGSDGELRYLIEVLHHLPVSSPRANEQGLVGHSPAFNEMLGLVSRVAPSEASVLLQGESGTGKELVARAIHDQSHRREGPFVPVECSGLTETLFESELFGHERGAFTGATHARAGLVESASGGTLFLDEIGDVPPGLQVKLLRLLETRTFRRVGSSEPRRADFRLVCASHRDLRQLVRDGEFREDLYYRLSTFPIRVPPLRERKPDIPVLAEALFDRLDLPARPHLAAAARDALEHYAFPGNIRELRNILERAALLSDGHEIRAEHLGPEVTQDPDHQDLPPPRALTGGEIRPLEEVEREYLRYAATVHRGDRRSLAARLGLSERSLYRYLQKLDAPGPDPRA
ncbi:sigma-54-dependent Fis family transcriptional regulator [Thioalkalivibrio sp. ALJ24]|uniref:sigma-54 interaction domain-containing protein n=1 Tax=Thioalkalivibrio sp. ALJ24 TaxID=545276 RepID=UPI000363D81B|nr:sigma-54-dependent Fis family transcriptional regulator [Thioalkalivibrio sp. ALJ24]